MINLTYRSVKTSNIWTKQHNNREVILAWQCPLVLLSVRNIKKKYGCNNQCKFCSLEPGAKAELVGRPYKRSRNGKRTNDGMMERWNAGTAEINPKSCERRNGGKSLVDGAWICLCLGAATRKISQVALPKRCRDTCVTGDRVELTKGYARKTLGVFKEFFVVL